jgi:hypothetical protein
MHERFIDRIDRKVLIDSSPDFKLRYHTIPPKQVVYSYVAVLLAVIVIVAHLTIKLVNLDDNQVIPTNEIITALFAIGVLISAAAVFSCVLIYKIHHIVTETEFQSLLFSSSMRVGFDFCMIVNSDKNVVYCDYNFSQIFSSFKDHSDALRRLMEHEGLKQDDKDKIIRSIVDGKPTKAPFKFTKTNGDDVKMLLACDPISRPSGFTIIRGYKES